MVELLVKEELREQIKKLKGSKTYQQFLSELINKNDADKKIPESGWRYD